MNVLAYATLTVSSTAVSLTSNASTTLPSQCKRAFISCETDSVRWRADGTAPTATEGHELLADDSISFTGGLFRPTLERVQFIKVTNDAKLKITYYD